MTNEQAAKVLGIRKFLPWLPRLLRNPFPEMVALAEQEGGLIYLDLLPSQRLLVITDPEWARYLLKDQHQNFSRRTILNPLSDFLGEGLFRSEGALWQQMHTLIKPAFHDRQIQHYYELITQEADSWLNHFTEKGNKEIDVESFSSRLLLSLLLKTQFCACIEYPIEEILQCQLEIIASSSYIQLKKRWLSNQLRSITPGLKPIWRPQLPALDRLDQIITDIRARAKKEQPCFLLAQLEEAATQGTITDRQVRDEMMNLIFAGFDTTAAALAWTLYAAARYPETLPPVMKELASLEGNMPNPTELSKMTETRFFVQESLRMFPPIWALFRVSLQPTHFGNFQLPQGGYSMVSIYGMHHLPSVWGDPWEFRPSRFQPEEFRGKSFAYLPFGHGPRICIGKPLAMVECQLLFLYLLKKGNWKLAENQPPIKIETGIIRKSKNGLKLRFEP